VVSNCHETVCHGQVESRYESDCQHLQGHERPPSHFVSYWNTPPGDSRDDLDVPAIDHLRYVMVEETRSDEERPNHPGSVQIRHGVTSPTRRALKPEAQPATASSPAR